MIAPDGISPLARYAALIADVPVIQLAEPAARELGLREGQVVQGAIQARGDALVLDLGGRFFLLPPALARASPGDLRWFKVIRQREGLALRPMPPAGSASQTSATEAELPPASQTSRSEMGAGEPLPSARHAGLLARPASLSALNQLLVPGRLESDLIDAGAPELAQALALSRVRSDALSAQTLQQALARSGFWTEAMLAAGRPATALDLKSLLRQISRALGGRGAGGAAEVDDAVDQIERKQLESVQSQADGRYVISMMLPFADAEPAMVRFEREQSGGKRAKHSYTIDLHIAPPALGDFWVKTIVDGNQVDVTVWTQRSAIAALARSAGEELESELQDARLRLRAFRVLDGPRPDSQTGSIQSSGTSGMLDLKA